jgi:hypothetical protein
MDFTLKTYSRLLNILQQQGYEFLRYRDFHKNIESQKTIILRHDVDTKKENSLQFAKIQYKMGIVGSYYFRVVPQSFNEKIIKEIDGLGHEIGYHYETMDTSKGNLDKAYDEFCSNLELFRKLVPVVTICMHGSPRSQFDNKAIWHKFDYNKLGIIGEPYFDINFGNVFYLTDTGRRWDGWEVSIRDKIPGHQERWCAEGLVFHGTQQIMDAACIGILPEKIMITFHPQRWNDKSLPWFKELVMQRIKNAAKGFLLRINPSDLNVTYVSIKK